MDYSVSIPDRLTDEEWIRMCDLFTAKIALERHAFGSDSIRLIRKDGKITLDGLPITDAETIQATMHYLVHLAALAKEAKRVNRTDTALPENEKYAFRIWLLRLGFIGSEYKQARSLLLRNLPGSAARKTGRKEVNQDGETQTA